MSDLNEEENQDLEEFDTDDISEDDYVFVISPEGLLKTIIFPDELMEDPPEEVQKILQVLGVKSIHLVEPRTLH